MKTYFTATIHTENGQGCSSTSAACKTREDALTVAFADATYYLGHHRGVHATIEEYCDRCHGEGSLVVRRPRSIARKNCCECRGHKGPISRLSFPCNPHQCVRTIDNGTGEIVTHGR